jgi:hypothetical protein
MTSSEAGDEGKPESTPARFISVVDAVCCVYFCAAGKSGLLISILTELGMEILIPAEVEREVLRKQIGQVQAHWPRLRASQRVQILDDLTITDARPDVVATVARIRGTSAELALSVSRDLGEAVVIGHAKVLADAGHEVYVVIDDQGGQALASAEHLEILTVEDLLIAALHFDLLAPDQLRKTYEALIPFGSGLPTWNASRLKQLYKEWRDSKRELASNI